MTPTLETDDQLIGGLDAEVASLVELCSGFEEADWDRPTGCPGWSVKDNLSHLVDGASQIAGRPRPDHELAEVPPHVRSEMGERMEVAVDYRRPLPGEAVLKEFGEASTEALEALRTMGDLGDRRENLSIITLDWWVHEQDIRRAVGRAGHLEGPVAEHARDNLLEWVAGVVGSRARAAPGTRVAVAVTGPGEEAALTATVGEGDGDGAVSPGAADDAAVTVRTDLETFCALACGRADAEERVAAGAVEISGDEELGRRVVAQMGVTP